MSSMDGLKKQSKISQNTAQKHLNKPILHSPGQKIQVRVITANTPKSKIRLFKGVNINQVATIFASVLITFGLSLAISQGMADNNSPAVNPPTASLPRTSGLTVTSQPLTMSFDQIVKTKPGQVYLPRENVNLPDPLLQRQQFLQQYLSLKHSPLADHVDALSEQTQWKLIIAISQAESSACKKMPAQTYNCWGIGGAWNLKHYANYDQAIADVNRILEQHYIQAGLDSPTEIEHKWVGYKSAPWQAAVQEVMNDLQNQN